MLLFIFMKKFFNKIKNLYKFLVQIFFKRIYGKIIYASHHKNTNNLVIKKVCSQTIKKKENFYQIYLIKKGRICTDYVENVSIIDNNKIVDNASYQQIKGELKNARFNSAIKRGTPYFKKKFNGNILCLTQGASGHSNYFHWLFDILPKIKIFSKIYNLDQIEYFYLSKLKDFQKTTLKLLKCDKIKIIESNRYRHVSANKIFAVDHPWYSQGYILNEAKNLPMWIINWLRNSFLTAACKFDNNEKIFIDRTESQFNHCQLQNNNEVSSFLKSRGFTTYKVGQLTFEQQIYLFKKAKLIVGAHGAAFANLTFCSPGTKIVEIKPLTHPNYVSKTICRANDLDIKYIETPHIRNKKNLKGDINLNLNELKKYI